MTINMNFAGTNNKIIDGIIKFVAINMMDDFIGTQGASKMLFHDVSMFKDTLAVNSDLPVSLCGNASLPVCSFLSDIGVSIPFKSEVMAIAKSKTVSPVVTLCNLADIGDGVLNEFTRRISLNAAHKLPSLPFSIQQIDTDSKRDDGANRVNSVKPLTDNAEGNTEPSRGYTPGRCNDYRRGLALLITGKSARLERDEIVYSLWKHKVSRYVTDRDGVGVTKPAASTVSCGFAAAGIVAETIAAGAYGLIQVYGYHSAVLQRATTGAALKTTHGTPMTLSLVANFSLEPMVTGYASTVVIKNQFPMAFSLGRVTTRTVTGVALAAFIRCL